MIGLNVNDVAIMKQREVLEKVLSTNPETRTALQKVIREAILEARADVVQKIKFKNGDPRGTAAAVRTTVYRKLLGANINIYNSRKAHGMNSYEPPVKGSNGRGGNRRFRSPKTQRMMSYAPMDRGMILRWINNGVKDRSINFKRNDNRKEDKWNKHPNTGNRGHIASRNFFLNAAQSSFVKITGRLEEMIDTEIDKIMNSNQ